MQLSTHPVSQEQVMAYLDGELPVDQASLVATHLGHCPECQALAADLESVARRLLEWQIETPSEQMSEPLREALGRAPAHRAGLGRYWVNRPWVWIAGAAAAILAIALVDQPWNRHPTGSVSQVMKSLSIDGQPAADENGTIGKLERKPQLEQYANLQRAPGFAAKQFVPQETTGPLIVRTAELALTARQFGSAQGEMQRILAGHQGYIAQLTINSASGQARSLNATLRVPATQLDALLSELRKVGHVDSESQRGDEVTQQSIDLDARLTNARETEQRLTQLLRDRTGRLSDVLAVEEQINNVRGQIEQMEAERKSLSNRIAFATLELTIAEIYQQSLSIDQGSTSTKLRNAAVEGYRHLANASVGTLRFALSYGPILLVLAAIFFFPARALWRRRASFIG